MSKPAAPAAGRGGNVQIYNRPARFVSPAAPPAAVAISSHEASGTVAAAAAAYTAARGAAVTLVASDSPEESYRSMVNQLGATLAARNEAASGGGGGAAGAAAAAAAAAPAPAEAPKAAEKGKDEKAEKRYTIHEWHSKELKEVMKTAEAAAKSAERKRLLFTIAALVSVVAIAFFTVKVTLLALAGLVVTGGLLYGDHTSATAARGHRREVEELKKTETTMNGAALKGYLTGNGLETLLWEGKKASTILEIVGKAEFNYETLEYKDKRAVNEQVNKAGAEAQAAFDKQIEEGGGRFKVQGPKLAVTLGELKSICQIAEAYVQSMSATGNFAEKHQLALIAAARTQMAAAPVQSAASLFASPMRREPSGGGGGGGGDYNATDRARLARLNDENDRSADGKKSTRTASAAASDSGNDGDGYEGEEL
jgi:hypothetical protein